MRLKNVSIAVLVGAGLAISAPVATAQTSPVQQGYSKPGGVVQTQIDSSTPKPQPEARTSNSAPAPASQTQSTPAAETSQLPFTGLDIGLVLAAAAMLLAAGFGIRRLSRSAGTA